MKFITIGILLFAAQIYCEGTTDMSSSGDGEEATSIVSVTMIDEKGEILGYIKPTVNNTIVYQFMSGVNAEEGDYDTNSTTTEINATVHTDASTSEAPTTTIQTTTTEDTTTVTTTTTAETTTTASSTTTTLPTTTIPPTTTTITTTTIRPTTKTSTKISTTSTPTTKIMKPQLTTRTSRPPLTVAPTYIPNTEKKLCTFEDNNLMCNEEIYCYGEGEIDCSEEASLEVTSAATELSSLASISEDYVDYEASEGAIGTFPPNLVGVISPKKRFPSLFKMGSLGTTDMSSDEETKTTVHSITTSLNTAKTTTMAVNNMDTTTQVETTVALDDNTTVAYDSKITEVLNTETTMAPDIETAEFILLNDSAKLTDVNETMSTEGLSTTTEYVSLYSMNGTSQNENTTLLLVEDNNENNVTIRRKREESSKSKPSSSSVSLSFQAAELKSLKLKMHVKACRITGNLVCRPSPTTSMCTGKTYCKAVAKEPEESAEKATNAETYRDISTTIIVIVAVGGAITIALIIYFIAMAYKRGKVQPQNGVTTLNYVNSATLP